VEIDGQLRKVMVVVKMRGGNHSKNIREYEITSDGIVLIGPRLRGYQGLMTGVPAQVSPSIPEKQPSPKPKTRK
jgi:circadian clock protein KaiC